jgi:hypothetical protein
MPTYTMPSLPGLDFSKLDLSKLQLPKIDLSKIDLSKIDVSKFDPRKIDLSKVDVPRIDLPGVDVDRLGELARDAAYVGIGLVALTAEKVAERGRVIQAEITARGRRLLDAVA